MYTKQPSDGAEPPAQLKANTTYRCIIFFSWRNDSAEPISATYIRIVSSVNEPFRSRWTMKYEVDAEVEERSLYERRLGR